MGELQKRLHEIFHSNDSGILIAEKQIDNNKVVDYIICHCNDSLGKNINQWIGKSVFFDVNENTKARYIELFNEIIASKEQKTFNGFYVVEFDNKIIISLCNNQTMMNGDDRFKLLLDSLYFGVIVVDRDLNITEWDEMIHNASGLTKEEMIGKPFKITDYMFERGKYDEIINSLRNGKTIGYDNLKVVNKRDNEVRYIQSSYMPLMNHDNEFDGFINILIDNSERYVMERRNKNLIDVIDNAGIGVVIRNNKGIITDWNIGAKHIFGYDGQEVIGTSGPSLYTSPSDQQLDRKNVVDIYEKKKSFAGNYKKRTKSGDEIYVYAQYLPLLDNEDNMVGNVSIYQDITREYEEREYAESLATIVRNSSSGTLIFDLNDKITYANDSASSILGFSNEELLNSDCFTNGLYFKKRSKDEIINKVINGYKVDGLELEFITKEEQKIYLLVNYAPIKNQFGDVVHYTCAFEDVTNIHMAMEQLQVSYDETTKLIQTMPAPMVVFAADGEILEANQAYASLLGINDSQDLIGRNSAEFNPQLQSHLIEETAFNYMSAGGNHRIVATKVTGEPLYLIATMQKMNYRGRDVFVGHCRDIELQMRSERALREAAEDARIASETKSNFLANMSHEIRTPLNGVLGFAELALDDDKLSRRTAKYLENIRSSANGLLSIINDILDITKIESGKMELKDTPFILQDVCDSAILINKIKSEEKGISLLINIEPIYDKKLIGDPTKLRQVLVNILSNAIKFTEFGSVSFNSKIKKVTDKYTTILFEIIDTGIGMEESEIKIIFESFMQADASTTREYGGTGLGLPITKSLVELMGGKLEVASSPGVGSRFYFTLTFETIENNEIEVVQYNQENGRPVFDALVLVCEDNIINQTVIKANLDKLGITTIIAENGLIGFETVQKYHAQGKIFDLILMDIHMPELSGIEATKLILKQESNIPIIAMTANVLKNEIEKYYDAGMVDFIGKPYTNTQLWSILLKYLKPIRYEEIRSNQKEIDVIDSKLVEYKIGIKRCANDEDLYKQMKETFYKTNLDFMERLNDCLSDLDVEKACKFVHTLKSNAATIGAVSLSSLLSKVELQLKMILSGKTIARDNSEYIDIRELIKQLDAQLSAVLNELEWGII